MARGHGTTAGLALVAVLAACGFRASAPMAVEVSIRNVSPGPVLVQISAAPSGTQTYTIQPWQEGKCFARLAFDPGDIEIRVSGSNVEPAQTYSVYVPDNETLKLGVQVFGDGRVQFGGDFPADKIPCVGGGY